MRKGVFAVLCILPSAFATEPTSPLGNVEAVCRYVSSGISSYGDRFLKLKLPEDCRSVKGIGEATLLAFNKPELNCYKEVAAPLCTLQFTEYEATQSCSQSLSLFFSLIRTCQQSSLLSATHATCTSFNRTANTILDPEAFCQSSHLRSDKASGNQETATGFELRNFSRGEMTDCRRLAETFNACQLVAVKVLGYKKSFCVDGGFSAYCKKYPTIVRDPTFKSICRNIVIPYLMESTKSEDATRQAMGCTDIVPSYLRMLQTRADGLRKKSAAAAASYYSLQAAASVKRDVEAIHAELSKVVEQLDTQTTGAVNTLKEAAKAQMTLNKDVQDMLTSLEEAATAAEKDMALIRYPELSEDADENVDVLSDAAAAVAPLSQKLQRCADTVNEISKKLTQPGYLAKGQAYGFVAIDAAAAAKLQDRLKRITTAIKPFSKFISDEIEKNGAPDDPALEQSFKNAAADFAQLNEIYKRQIAVVNSAHKFGVQAQTLMTAATSTIS